MFDNSSQGLYRQIILVTLIPVLILSVVLAGYFIWNRVADNRQMLLERGETIASVIAVKARRAVSERDSKTMQYLSESVSQLDGVSDIIFLNPRFKVLSRTADFPLEITPSTQGAYRIDERWYFVDVITAHQDSGAMFSSASQSYLPSDILGWVVVLIDNGDSAQRQREIIVTSSAIILFILLLSAWLARSFARQIMTPINEISSVVEAFQNGDFSAVARESHAGKLQSLATGVNRMATRIKVSTTDMETRVDSATRRLQAAMHHLEQQNETLEATQRKEVEANQAKDQFLARMSHELRTPLTSVLGFSKLLKESNPSEDQIEPIRIINHTSQMLLSIVDDILDFSKLQKNAITLERIDFNVETALLDVLEMQAPMAHSKGLELSLVCGNGRSYDIKGDPTRFKQIVSNLVANAVKFTDTGSVAISLDTQYISSHQSLLIISVTDTGIGISQEQLNKLFKAFVQADTSITRRFGGSGLGLVIAKTLTKLMGGKLEIYSKQAKGTNVTLQIPALIGHTESVEQPSSFNQREPVLVYDDNQHTKRSIALMLERRGFEYYSVNGHDDLLKVLGNYSQAVIGIKATDTDNLLINSLLPRFCEQHRDIVFALPNGHPIPDLPNHFSVINKPIRPQVLFNQRTVMQRENPEDATAQGPTEITVVVAEDNTFNQLLITRILAKHNILSFIASNGKEALALIEKHQPDLAILDIHMPVMDGFEATRQIRLNSDLPIIALTANIIQQDHQKITEAGSNAIVLKPINDVELIRQIRNLTKAASNSSASAASALPTDISEYNLDQSVLAHELMRLLGELELHFKPLAYEQMRSLAHQLVGLAGLYQLPDVEMTTVELQNALHEQSPREIWHFLSRLKRTVKGSLEELDTEALENAEDPDLSD
ncbi:MAG: ATP-binding protein [Pseudomonadales bacterium]